MTTFPESRRDLLDAQVASLATIGRDDFPQLTGGRLIGVSARRRPGGAGS